MELEEIRKKYQCDEGRTFAQWKEWVRKNKPSQAQAHIVKAVAPNGSKYEIVIGGYTDAQNTAFDLVSHGYKDVKLYHSVNAGPLKLLRNFSAPLHGAKFKDSADSVDEIRQKYQEDKLSITSNGFANGNGVLKKDTRKGLKPFEVAFFVKGKDGKPFKTVRSKMAASLEEAKRWANQESRKYNGVTKVDVKEFKDEADCVDSIREKYANDAAFGIKVKGNEKGSERLTMEKVFKELNPAPAWKKVKKGNTIVIRTNINGKDQDVVTIKYFNPNIVAMTPKGGAANMVALKDVTVMCSKLGVEGRRSYMDSSDSVDAVDGIRNKYQSDAVGAGVVNPNFKFQTNVEKRLATTRKGRAMTLPQYGKPSKVYVGKDGNFFAVFNTSGQKLSKTPFKTASEAESFARKNGWMVEKR